MYVCDGNDNYDYIATITKYGYNEKCFSDFAMDLLENTYPKRKVARVAVASSSEGQYWLEKDREYIVVAREKHRNRHYYIVKHDDGAEIMWGVEYFV